MTSTTKGLEQFYHVHPYVREVDEAITDLERAAMASGVNRDDAFEWAREHAEAFPKDSLATACDRLCERLISGRPIGGFWIAQDVWRNQSVVDSKS